MPIDLMRRLQATAVRSCKPAAVAGVLGAVGVLYRVVLVALDVPAANSDEGTAGLAAKHIAAGEHFPVFFYGQHYLGTAQSYLAAPLVEVFGSEWWALRIPPLLFYAGFLFCTFMLAQRLFSPWFAVTMVGFLSLGADRVVRNQLIGGGGYPETLLAVAVLCVLTTMIVSRPRSLRLTGLWGITAGFILWTHWLALPYVLASLCVISWSMRWRWGKATAGILGGTLIGAAPLLAANLFGDGPNSLSVLLSVSGTTQDALLGERLHGAVLIGIPLATGLCDPGRCGPLQMAWGPAYVALMTMAAIIAVRDVRRMRATGETAAMAAVRLMLVIGAALTLAAYVASASAAVTPTESARYLHYSLVSLPAVMWSLWRPAVSLIRSVRAGAAFCPSYRGTAAHPRRRMTGFGPLSVGSIAAAIALATILTGGVAATATTVANVSAVAQQRQGEQELIAALTERGITRFYTEYWTCNRIAFASGERLVCAVLGEDLRPGLDRYVPYRRLVAEAGEPAAFVFPRDAAVLLRLESFLLGADIPAVVEDVAGYRVIRPERPTGLPLP